jgi:hypothetical protein
MTPRERQDHAVAKAGEYLAEHCTPRGQPDTRTGAAMDALIAIERELRALDPDGELECEGWFYLRLGELREARAAALQ